MTRARFVRAALAAVLVASVALIGCTPAEQPATPAVPETAAPLPVKIGTLATEDSLPLWVAEDKGYFAAEKIPAVEIVLFQRAQERDAAFSSGAIDAYMGDIIAAANLEAAGTKNTIVTLMLGEDQTQGRFGIAVPKGSDITSLEQLKGVPVGTSSATIQEYVLDGLMTEAGVAADDVKKEEVKKVPVRFELLQQGKLKAAALPEPFLSLVEQSGGTLVGDDTKSKTNLSQTVLVFADDYLSDAGGLPASEAVLAAWDKAVGDINADPDAYRAMLVDKARLPEALAATYKVNTYPMHQLPKEEQVNEVLSWMKAKGYLKAEVGYVDLTVVMPTKQ